MIARRSLHHDHAPHCSKKIGLEQHNISGGGVTHQHTGITGLHLSHLCDVKLIAATLPTAAGAWRWVRGADSRVDVVDDSSGRRADQLIGHVYVLVAQARAPMQVDVGRRAGAVERDGAEQTDS